MGNGFAKIYGDKLLRSTLFLEPPEARLVFLAMLAMANAEGFVDVPGVRALANVLNLPEDYVRRALKVLEAPDPESRSKAEEGRRILPLDVGWQLVNYVKYREHRTDRQEATRKRVAKHRKRTRNNVRTEAEAEAATDVENPPNPPRGAGGKSRGEIVRDIYVEVTGSKERLVISAQWTPKQTAAILEMGMWADEQALDHGDHTPSHAESLAAVLRPELQLLKRDKWLRAQPIHIWAQRLGTGSAQAQTGSAPAPEVGEYVDRGSLTE